ncbi:P27 family phage terminase small subunit [Bacillus paranthracis]|uniref:P27 family phage terminase small subunit n=1 Tax=Bacillus paranthracis TaxID=2026186 RepID=UPI002550F55D|nr:P27 family phage terminase small subunit [Bacillus paranthracis]MDK7419260.1 P27 family phage terminase small subunit [Bacillus paranthracis]MDK7430875.1 P27 family phage terminase small subunit [Bacillus paranthracis]MDK7572394.1 P27 family phage terminase small subunit [Bacillus paranthracis]
MTKYIDPRATKEMEKTPNKLDDLIGSMTDFNENFTPIENEPPEFLDNIAKEYYRIFVGEIQKLGTANILDEGHLINLCETLSDIRHYREAIKRDGHFIQGPHNIKEHPAIKALDTATKNSIRLMNELNLSAATRKFLKEELNSADNILNKYQ